MTILDKILAQKEVEVRELKAIYNPVRPAIQQRPSLYDSFRKANTMNVIAEVKRASPSKGDINQQVDPVAQALAYQAGGAGAISVLTDRKFFQGSMQDLAAVSEAVDIPVLCKEFIIDRVQINAAIEHGASVILLIAAALPEGKLQVLYHYGRECGLDVLFEVHDEREAEMALKMGARIIGINNRNLKTFKVDLAVTEQVAATIRSEDTVIIGESGIRTKEDVKRLEAAGAQGILVGETLMCAENIQHTIEEFRIPLHVRTVK